MAVLFVLVAAFFQIDTRAETPLMPLEEIRAGMIGVGRTIFEADSMEEFGVEILGVLRNAVGPGSHLILARLKGEKIEYTGVVLGMSGSPVYIDGKLVGAISYTLGPFAKEPIAGITPIQDMIRLSGSAVAEAVDDRAAPDLLGAFLSGLDDALPDDGEVPPGSPFMVDLPGAPVATAPGLQPIGTPLVCSGCDASVLGYYAPIFRAHGLEPAAGGGASGDAASTELKPGSAIGAAMVLGDLSITGIGTLTEVNGDTVYGFGHPFLGVGSLEIPMTGAQVLATYPSEAASFKIANATAPVGTIVRDGLTAIVGEIGRMPPMIPVRVAVDSAGVSREFNFEILTHRAWSPVMVALVTANSLTRTTEYDAPASLALRYRIEIEGHEPIEMEDLFSRANPNQPVHVALANRAGAVFGLLSNNRFEAPRFRKVDIEVDVLAGAQVATVTALSASKSLARPGDVLTVTAELSPYRAEPRTVSWKIRLPEDTPKGKLAIVVGGGTAINSLERRILQRQIAQAGNLGDLVRLVDRQRKNHMLYLRFTRRAPSAVVRSEILPDLPLSVFSVFNHPRLSSDTTLMMDAPILERSKEMDLVTVGGRRITIKVQ